MRSLLTRRSLLAGVVGQGPRRAVSFHYAANFSPQEVEWYGGFQILVTGAILDRAQSALLARRGTRLVAYEWSSAFYAGDFVSAAEVWQRRMRPAWSLTPSPVSGGAAEGGKPAIWYDFADPHLVEARATYLAGILATAAYDGFFFDTLGFEQLPAPARDAFIQRHPGKDYNVCQGNFLAVLRAKLPLGKLIFTNQGYRHADSFLPHADLDLTESYFTALAEKRTVFRPWHDPQKPWESIRTPMVELVLRAKQQYPGVRFVHVNYAAGPAADAALYSLACAKLFAHESYLIVPGASLHEQHPGYSAQLGRPLTESFEEDLTAGAAWRRYEGGIVAILSGRKPFLIPRSSHVLSQPERGYIFA